MDQQLDQIEAVFNEALEKASPEERSALRSLTTVSAIAVR